ncbi:MAG TPA: dihydropteroate synthase [Arenibaculum sp.]|nr:dihydropteroate synthase [Arenibaculum sp.]
MPAGGDGTRIFLRPVGILDGRPAACAVASGQALPLAGGGAAFALAELVVRSGERVERATAVLGEILAWARARGVEAEVAGFCRALAAPRAPFAGFAMDRPRIMGIVNVTPDSFSDGGEFFDAAAAIAHGTALIEAGAEILDVGGESTRPGADPVGPREEMRRVLPVVRHFAERGIAVSIDTRHAAVMGAALDAGARIVNDVTALGGDADAAGVVRRAGAPVILMHMQGEPRTMQHAPCYRDAPTDVFEWLAARLRACTEAGIARETVAVDYGIGFGKTVDHNLELLDATSLFHALGVPLLVGVSRKAFIGRLSRGEPARGRMPGSLAAGLAAIGQGAQMLRVHDVAETAQAVAVAMAVASASRDSAGRDGDDRSP